MKRMYISRIIAAVFVVLGATVGLYPTLASWIYQYNQSKLFDTYSEETHHTSPSVDEQIEEAHRYNNALQSGADLRSNANKPTGVGTFDNTSIRNFREYHELLSVDDTGIMGRIIVDKADVDLPIYHGATTQNLLKGSAHLEGTSLPVGGIGTRTVITGHRGLASAEMFTHLDRLEEGDLFSINILGRVYSYKVIDIQVVSPEESDSIRPVEGKDLATLITCTPLGINSHRILITGERVYPTPAVEEDRATSASNLPRFPWLLLGGAVLILLSLGSITHSSIGIWKEKRNNSDEES